MTHDDRMPSREEIERGKEAIRETLCCPYCGERLSKWAVPQTLWTTWPNEFMYICFNDRCPYFVRGRESMAQMGNAGSYRLMYDPVTDTCQPVPVLNRRALRDGIVDESKECQEPEPEVSQEMVVGAWKLVSFEEWGVGGEPIRPSGDSPTGFLIYGRDGRMSVQNQDADGTLRLSAEPLCRRGQTRQVALEALGAYNGRYEIESGNRILHHIDVSLHANWVGLTQERIVRIEGDRLTLVSPPLLIDEREVVAYMTWERAG